jgi:DNA-binding transcriptional ArsR family regulator
VRRQCEPRFASFGDISARTERSAAYAGPMEDIAEVAALLADRSRVAMLDVLLDGAAHPVGVLADAAGIAPSTASEHLARLAGAGLVSGHAHGRRRLYVIADPGLATTLEALGALAHIPQSRTNGLRNWNKMQRLRAARTCYDHLAGRLGVFLADAAQQQGALTADFVLTETAPGWFERLGVTIEDLPRTRRPFIRVCNDWTERREHLAGTLGAAVCTSFFSMGWISRVPGGRAVRVTPAGAEALSGLGAWESTGAVSAAG